MYLSEMRIVMGKIQSFNEWFAGLEEGRQKVLRENKWMLAKNAYNAMMEELVYFKRRTVLAVAGWGFSAVSLYDEEGVEGWHWESPGGDDYYEMGDWSELAEIPEEVEKIADKLINQ